MAIVKSISSAMVNALSGTVEFYLWKGIPVARSWPRYNPLSATPEMLAARLAFTQSRVDLRAVSGTARAAWAACSAGEKQAWLDYYTSVFMRTWKDYRRYPAVLYDFSLTTE